MEEENSPHDDPAPALADAPFLVAYHYRHRRLSHKPRLPRPLRHTARPHSIILTRKMAAQIETHPHPPASAEGREECRSEGSSEGRGEGEERQFFSPGELERGIPMEDKDDGDILYNLGSLTVSQSYSKLERTLFGLAPHEEEVDAEVSMC
jgi:hypothetical protein